MGCEKEKLGNTQEKYGNTHHQLKVTSKSYVKKKSTELKYTQFGDFITSITPVSCVGELEYVRFYENSQLESSSFLTLVHREPNQGENRVLADFTNNATISLIPEINGDLILNPDGQGASFKKDVTMTLLWVRLGITQAFELPAQYTSVNLPYWNRKRVGNKITTGMIDLNQQVNELSKFGNEIPFAFGLTDSTFIEYGYLQDKYNLTRYIRSSKYKSWTMTPPLPDQTKTYVSTMGFLNDNIIQIYAGPDNIPYTSDDVIVLEPKYWEKIYVYVDEN
jgi:hypothetical protein